MAIRKRNVSGSISLRTGDLLISGCGKFFGYTTQTMQLKLGLSTFEGDESIYLGMRINKVRYDFVGIQLHPNGYGWKSTLLRFPWEEETCRRFLTEIEQAISRSGSVELMWVARLARPGAIYDASAAARAFGYIGEFYDDPDEFGENVTDAVSESCGASSNSAAKADYSHILVLMSSARQMRRA